MNQPILFLMLGFPGAGKTTTAKLIAKLTGATCLTSDQLRLKMFRKPKFTPGEHAALYKALDALAEEALAAGQSVIYDANLNRFIHRQEKYDICQRTGARAVLIWLKTPKQLAKERATHQNRHHLVPTNETADAMFERIAQIIEPPRLKEKALELDGTHISEQVVKVLLQRAGVL